MNLKYFSRKPKHRLTSHVLNEIFDEREKGSEMMEVKEFLMCLSLFSSSCIASKLFSMNKFALIDK